MEILSSLSYSSYLEKGSKAIEFPEKGLSHFSFMQLNHALAKFAWSKVLEAGFRGVSSQLQINQHIPSRMLIHFVARREENRRCLLVEVLNVDGKRTVNQQNLANVSLQEKFAI